MTDISNTDAENFKLTKDQKANIVENFFKRVSNVDRAFKIQRLALSLSDYDDTSDDYYAFLHFYSLEENWPKIDKDYNEFYIHGHSGTNQDFSLEPQKLKASSNGKKT